MEISAETEGQAAVAKSPNPYVFIVGCPRSGTTLFQRIVDAHPELAVIHETHWIVEFFEKRTGVDNEGLVTPQLVPRLLQHRRFPSLEMTAEDLEWLSRTEGGPVHFSAFVTRVYDLYGERRGKRLVGDKTPGNVRHLPTVHGLWPEARIVHLVRDGRDVALSWLDWKKSGRKLGRFASWHADPLVTVALWWRLNVRLGREFGESLPAHLYHEVRYERLVEDPAAECTALCDFLGVRYDDATLRFNEGRVRNDPRLTSKARWLPPTPGMRYWRSQMTSDDVELFEAAAGDLLDEFGYPRAFPGPDAAALRRAAAVAETFVADVHALPRGRLPERW
jgi:hypothetical protein